jgi:hypothetical protein
MADQFDPTMRSREAMGGAQEGMDPEGLMPADPEMHETPSTDDAGGGTAADALTSPHDQPVEGGREQAEDDPLGR